MLLPETEGVSTVAGSTIILIGTASREQHVTEVDTSDYACNAIGNEETSGEGFHVLVRCVDSQSHLNVRVAPETTTDELKICSEPVTETSLCRDRDSTLQL